MIIPIRCWSCGKPIAQLYKSYADRVAKGEDAGAVMTSLGAERYCCRQMLLGHVDLIETAGQFKKA